MPPLNWKPVDSTETVHTDCAGSIAPHPFVSTKKFGSLELIPRIVRGVFPKFETITSWIVYATL